MKIIAEIGSSHRGSLEKAGILVRRAAESGADIVKFQIIIAREILHPLTGSVSLPGGATPLFEVFQSLEQKPSFYKALKTMCEDAHVGFLASPFGPESAALLKTLNPGAVKIASPDLNYTSLLEELGSWKLPVYLSTGVSREEDIREALSYFSREDVVLLHCVTSYPAPAEDYNLAVLGTLKKSFAVKVGVSDHSLDPSLVPCLAFCQGAVALEKHFTLSRDDDGLDDPIALEPRDFALMTRRIRLLEELDPAGCRRQLEKWFGEGQIRRVTGDGRKVLALSERENYGRTNRSIHALDALEPGTVLSEKNCGVLRTEKILRPGLHPRYFRDIMGRELGAFVPDGEGIRAEDLLDPPGLIDRDTKEAFP